jgi:hypothetical protein
MQQQSHFSSLVSLDVAAMIKKEMSIGENQGLDENEIINGIAKALGHTPEYIQEHFLALMELPSKAIGIIRTEAVKPYVVLSVWKRTHHNPTETIKRLSSAIDYAKKAGAKETLLKHLKN